MTPDQIAAARAARRQAIEEVRTLAASIRGSLKVRRPELAPLIVLLGEAHEKLGMIKAKWPASDLADAQRLEQARQEVIAAETEVMVATRPPPRADLHRLAQIVAECFAVLETRDGILIDEEAVRERAANLAVVLDNEFDVLRRGTGSQAKGTGPTGGGGK